MKQVVTRFAFVLASVLAPVCVMHAQHNFIQMNENYSPTDWMERIPDWQPVYSITIPGSHDTATAEAWYGWKDNGGDLIAGNATLGSPRLHSIAQATSLSEQMAQGVRAFDFRPGYHSEGALAWKKEWITCDHGSHQTKKRFEDALTEMCDFLKVHHQEFFIIHLYPSDATDKLGNMLKDLMNDSRFSEYIIDFRPDLLAHDVRGKIIFLVRNQMQNKVERGGWMPEWTERPEFNDDGTPKRLYTINSYDTSLGSAKMLCQDWSDNSNETDQANKAKEQLVSKVFDYSRTLWSPNDTETREPVWILNLISGYALTTEIAGNSISKTDGYALNAQMLNQHVIDYIDNMYSDPATRNSGSTPESNYDYQPLGIVWADYVGVDYQEPVESAHKNDYETKGPALVDALIRHNISLPAGMTNIGAINVDDAETPAVYYNLQGIEMGSVRSKLAPGIYIERRGAKAEKVVL